MNIQVDKNNLIIEQVEDFNITQVLECGQCFHFDKIDENDYSVVAMGKYLHVAQVEDKLTLYNTSMEDYENIWKLYFDIDRDYKEIKRRILVADPDLKTAIEAKNGIRIVNQDFFEILISFIISQNKQISHIKQIVKTISEKYGEKIDIGDGQCAYTFPSVEVLSAVSEDELRGCKVGFRAPYIKNACEMVAKGQVTEEKLNKLEVNEARELLMTIKGVGEKVANCVLLFGLGRREVFPVDVWMKRIMETLYLKEDTPKQLIEKYAYEKYGDLGGYAQQYLFYYGREQGIGK